MRNSIWIRTVIGISFIYPTFICAEPVVESRNGDPVIRPSFSPSQNDLSVYPSRSSSQGNSSSNSSRSSSSQSSNSSSSRTDDQVRVTLTRIESLEQEVRSLRGQIEVQDHEIQRLSKSQKDLYVDLERRINQISGKGTGKRSEPQVSAQNSNASSKPIGSIPTNPEPILTKSTTVKPSSPKHSAKSHHGSPSNLYEPGALQTQDHNGDGTIIDPANLSTDPNSSVEASEEPLNTLPEGSIDTSSVSSPDSIIEAESDRPIIPELRPPVVPKKTSASLPIRGSAAEKTTYEAAYNFVLNKQYQKAVPALQSFLESYPEGQYTPNAHYWLGEVFLLQWRSEKNPDLLNKASQEFAEIPRKFPTHQKTMDALLKLGILENDRGNVEAARKYFTTVKERYPGTSVARLAQTHLQRLKSQ